MAASEVLSIRQFYDLLDEALQGVVGGTCWVEGEVSKLTVVRGHCYIDLVDPEDRSKNAGVLGLKCWQSRWTGVERSLAAVGVTLAPGMLIRVRGSVDLYRPRGSVGFIVEEVDVTALLGRLAVERAAIIEALSAEGLLEANGRRPLPMAPLRIGLVASQATEGCKDFLGQLRASPYAFEVLLCPATVQGATAPAELRAALDTLEQVAPPVDLVVMVRGGGAKADLQCFDDAQLARQIAACSIPVWTGLGHTGDEAIADLVAARAHPTPTACGAALVEHVSWAAARLEDAAGRVSEQVARLLEEVASSLERRRVTCATQAGAELRSAQTQIAGRCGSLARLLPATLAGVELETSLRTDRLAPALQGALSRAEDRLSGSRRLLEAYDVNRQLERGYSLTFDAAGRLVRQVGDAPVGTSLRTRVADGELTSTVIESERSS